MRVLTAVISILVLTGCVRQSLDPVVAPHNRNVLLPAVQFSTAKVCDAFVSYWPKGRPALRQESGVSSGRDHRIILLNVKPSTVYEYTIHTSDPDRITNALTFETGPLPPEVTHAKKVTVDTSQFNGYVLIRRLFPKGVDVVLDKHGDVVWYQLYDSVVRRPFNWTQNRSVLSVYDSSRIVEYNLRGDKVRDVNLKDHGMANILHHDAVLNSAGNVVALSHDSVKMDLRKLGLAKDQYLRGDGIIVFDSEGALLWKWNILDVYDPRDYPARKIDLTHSLGHANSIAIDKDGNYVVSFRDFSEVWKVNSTDGTVVWKLGVNGDIKLDQEGYFLRQHAVCYDDDGNLMLFDNGDRTTRPYSRVLSFAIDETRKVADIRTNVKLSQELSADKMCSAVPISDGKYLVCTSKRNGIISVVNDNSDVLWRVDLNSPSYRAYYLTNPFGAAGGNEQ